MKHFMVKFNHGVEIGAHLAYLGHYERTKDPYVLQIANEEVEHREFLAILLEIKGEKPSWFIDKFFWLVGTLIGKACAVAPESWLNKIARIMEMFAVISYNKLRKEYPAWESKFCQIMNAEYRHEWYFRHDCKIKISEPTDRTQST